MEHGFSCPVACEIFPGQGSNPCLQHSQADSISTGPLGKSKTFLFYTGFKVGIKCDFPWHLKVGWEYKDNQNWAPPSRSSQWREGDTHGIREVSEVPSHLEFNLISSFKQERGYEKEYTLNLCHPMHVHSIQSFYFLPKLMSLRPRTDKLYRLVIEWYWELSLWNHTVKMDWALIIQKLSQIDINSQNKMVY